MRSHDFVFLAILSAAVLPAPATGQSSLFAPGSVSTVVFTRVISAPDQALALPDSFIVYESEHLALDGRVLTRGLDYTLDYLTSTLKLHLSFARTGTLTIRYQRLLLPLHKTRFLQQPPAVAVQPDDTARAAQPLGTRLVRRSERRAFGAELEKSGSLVRAVSVGSNQGLKVDSGLRLQISGKVSEGVEVVAALTDQNTPIQPEGDTQTLQEIDKVFIQLKSERFNATLGDYLFGLQGTEFARYQRKLQGAMASWQAGTARVTLSGAVTRGKFRTQQFLGVEGKQGPYQLTGDRGQIDIIVLAGTERVWIDGEPMVRGENNDYVIEYGNGQITFTRYRLITGDSRITVDFQYSDERFQRGLYGMEAQVNALDEKVQLRTTLLRESDDKDNPIAFALSDEYLQTLTAAGDSLALADGAVFVGTGKGAYRLVDSVYVYAGQDSGDYQVRFSDLGEGRGRYRYDSFGKYTYVGPGQGRYEPVVILPRAQKQELADFRIDVLPAKNMRISAELALSNRDDNLYSSRDDGDNTGRAWVVEMDLQPEELRVFGVNLGKTTMRLRHRRRRPRYQDIDRTTVIEFGRRWDLGSNPPAGGDAISEAELHLQPWDKITFFGSGGALRQDVTGVASSRWELGTLWARPKIIELDYRIENIRRKREGEQENAWLRQRGRMSRTVWYLRPEIEFENEVKEETPVDTLRSGFRFTRLQAGLSLARLKKVGAAVRFTRRIDDDRFGTAFTPRSDARTANFELNVRQWRNLTLSAVYTHRRRDFQSAEIQDTRTDLAEIRAGYRGWRNALRLDSRYQITNTQVGRLERVYFQVRPGEGTYSFDEELNEYVQDPFGDYVLRLVPTDEFVPVVELRSRVNLRFQPRRALRPRKNEPVWRKVLRSLATDTFVRLEEKTRDPDVREIYFLNLSRYQNPEFTLLGTMSLRQDVLFFEDRKSVKLRYRLFSAKTLNNQFLGDEQRRREIRHELRLELRRGRSLAGRFELIRAIEDRTFSQIQRQDRFVRGLRFVADVSWRPKSRLELALQTTIGRDKDLAYSDPTIVDRITLKPRSTYSFRRKGRLRAEIEYTRVSATPADRLIPYELGQGNRIGTTFRWNLTFDYRVSKNLNASASYQGRDEPHRTRTIHLARVEMRAFF